MKIKCLQCMIAVPLLLFSFGVVGSIQSQEPVKQVWLDRFNGEDNGSIEDDYAEAICLDSAGNVLVTGFSFQQVQSNLYSPRFVTLKFQPDGTRQWAEFWRPGAGSSSAGGTVIGVDPQDNVIVGGFAFGSDDWGVIKYDTEGQVLWTADYPANSTFLTEPQDLFVDAGGNSYLTGDVGSFVNPDFGAVVKIDSAGEIDWVAEYHGPDFDGGSGNAVMADDLGNVYLVGAAVVSGFSGQAALVKFDSGGNLVWQRTAGSFFQFAFDDFRDVAIDNDGAIVVVGTFGNNTSEGSNIAIRKYNPAGDLIWSEEFDGGNGSDNGTRLAIDVNNNVLIAGSTRIDANNIDTVILKYDSDGNLVWSATQAGDGLGNDFPRDLAVDKQGNVYYAGVEEPFIGVDFLVTAALDADGNLIWKQLYGGPEQCCSSAHGIAVGAGGRVYSAGNSLLAGDDLDIVTIGFQQENPFVPGDINQDGEANLLDVTPFVDLLTQGGYQPEGDFNADHMVDLLDVAGFVNVMTN